ncbi:hypothetical protein FXO38_14849 [Capsicum annuum]|uniref:Putative plant transposon protein domain-containing protein n=1 Tax=Capsicum annuum TaxID=4072 RepID=A0A2G2ZNL9_CAPAN|nr:hypothetical protein FXO38_14849 [Capsicum annuum]KAF3657229.1 hypothetical protein FXO37_15059 [Capsicum annuum]PHT83589.1 hypothetical protein T459_12032 [Capsicum annuum]
MDESEESDIKPTISEHTGSEQTTFEKQVSGHTESEEHDLDHPDSEEHKSGKPNSEGPSIEFPSAEPQDDEESPIQGTMVKCKNPEVRDGTRWQIPKAQKIFLDRLCRTNRRVVKRQIFEEKRIITKGLSRYPKVEQKFRDYDLGWTTREGISVFPTLVREFYENYQARLENISTINKFLYCPNFTARSTSPTFYAWLKHRENQRSWLAILIIDGELEWLTNPSERIFKASLNSESRFWWGIVRTWLMPTDGDNILGDDRAILVTSFVANLKLNFGEITAEEIKI